MMMLILMEWLWLEVVTVEDGTAAAEDEEGAGIVRDGDV